jgi:hypothetical protein
VPDTNAQEVWLWCVYSHTSTAPVVLVDVATDQADARKLCEEVLTLEDAAAFAEITGLDGSKERGYRGRSGTVHWIPERLGPMARQGEA